MLIWSIASCIVSITHAQTCTCVCSSYTFKSRTRWRRLYSVWWSSPLRTSLYKNASSSAFPVLFLCFVRDSFTPSTKHARTLNACPVGSSCVGARLRRRRRPAHATFWFPLRRVVMNPPLLEKGWDHNKDVTLSLGLAQAERVRSYLSATTTTTSSTMSVNRRGSLQKPPRPATISASDSRQM